MWEVLGGCSSWESDFFSLCLKLGFSRNSDNPAALQRGHSWPFYLLTCYLLTWGGVCLLSGLRVSGSPLERADLQGAQQKLAPRQPDCVSSTESRESGSLPHGLLTDLQVRGVMRDEMRVPGQIAF